MSKNTTTENPPVGDENGDAGASTEETQTPPVEPGVNARDAPGTEDPETFSREYVQTLRAEGAAARIKAKRADDAEARLREVAIAQAVSDLLMAPGDLSWSDALADANGFPDHDKIRAAAEGLIASKPYLARPRGDVGQGQRGDVEQQVSLSGLLRARA